MDKNLLLLYIQGFEFVFTKKEFDILLEHYLWDHAIKFVSGLEPKSSKVYSLSPIEQVKLNIFLSENLKTGYIYLFKSSVIPPVFFIKKKDSSLKLV